MAALVLARPFDDERRAWRLGIAGAFTGAAFLYKPSAMSAGAVLILMILISRPGANSIARRARSLAVYGLGGLAVLGLVTLPFALAGCAGDLWFATLGYNLTVYKALYGAAPTWLHRTMPLWTWRSGEASLLAAALVAALATKRDRRAVLLMTWFLLDIALALLPGNGYPHYFLPVAISGSFASALLLRPAENGRAMNRLARAAALLLVVQWVPVTSRIARRVALGFQQLKLVSPDEQIADAVLPLIRPTAPLFLWGHFHGPLLYLDNPPASPLLSTTHLGSRYGDERWGAALRQGLIDHPPPVIIDTTGELLTGSPVANEFLAADVRALETPLRRDYSKLPLGLPRRQVFVRR